MPMWKALFFISCFFLDGSILCLDAIHHAEGASVDAAFDMSLLGYPNVDANHDVDDDANLHDVDVILLVRHLPIHHPTLHVDAAIHVHLVDNLNDDLLLFSFSLPLR